MTTRSRTPFFVAGLMAALTTRARPGRSRVRRSRRQHDHHRAAGHGRGLGARCRRRDLDGEDLRQRIEGRRRDRGAWRLGLRRLAEHGAGFRVRGRREGPHRDEPARRRRSLVDLGELLERRRAERRGRGNGPVHRPRRPARRRIAGAPRAAPVRRFERGRGRRPGARVRQPVRSRRNRHQRDRERSPSRDDGAQYVH